MTIEHKPSTQRSFDLAFGCRIATADGEDLGTLKQIEGSYFKVDAPLQRDYWLCTDDIASTDEGAVVLSFDKETLGDHKHDAPGLEPDDDPFRDVTIAPVLGEDDLLEQRATMERELAEQSKRLTGDIGPTVTKTRPQRELERIPVDHTGFAELAGQVVAYAPAADECTPPSNSGATPDVSDPIFGDGAGHSMSYRDMTSGGTDESAPLSALAAMDELLVDAAREPDAEEAPLYVRRRRPAADSADVGVNDGENYGRLVRAAAVVLAASGVLAGVTYVIRRRRHRTRFNTGKEMAKDVVTVGGALARNAVTTGEELAKNVVSRARKRARHLRK